jgi:hypothetical protein
MQGAYRHFRIGKATFLQLFRSKLGLKQFYLCWVPHALSISQKSERVSYSKLLLMALMEQEAGGFQPIIPGDELWFLPYHPRDSVWAASPDELPQRVTPTIDTEKCLVSILWSVSRIHNLRSSLMLLCPV